MFKDIVIVTPTLGGRDDSLHRTVESVRAVLGNRVEHILVCPASVCRELQQRYPGCRVLVEPDQRGVYAAVNFGISSRSPTVKYIGYINDDDSLKPGYLDLVRAMDCDPDLSVAYGTVTFVSADGTRIHESTSSRFYTWYADLLAWKITVFTQQATLMRQELYERLGGFDEDYRLVADTDFWVRAVRANAKMRYVAASCATYMIHESQLSANKELQAREYERLWQVYAINKTMRARVRMLMYRFVNLPNYLRRLQFSRCRLSVRVRRASHDFH